MSFVIQSRPNGNHGAVAHWTLLSPLTTNAQERAARAFAKRYGLNMPSARLAVDLCGIGEGGSHG